MQDWHIKIRRPQIIQAEQLLDEDRLLWFWLIGARCTIGEKGKPAFKHKRSSAEIFLWSNPRRQKKSYISRDR